MINKISLWQVQKLHKLQWAFILFCFALLTNSWISLIILIIAVGYDLRRDKKCFGTYL